MIATLLQDLRYGARALAGRPGFAGAALLTLALAIGANTLVFSLVSALYLAPLPYRNDARLVDIENAYPGMGLAAVGASIPDYLDRRAQVPALADSALYTAGDYNLALAGAPERVRGLRATPSLFTTLGVGAALGRTFDDTEAEPGTDRVVVLSDALWRNRFGADPAAVGRDLHANGETYRIIGVMPRGFMFPDRQTGLYFPFAFTPAQKADTERGFEFSTSIGRLAPGATLADVRTQGDLVIRRNMERLGAAGGDGARFAQFVREAGFTVNVRPLRTLLAGDRAQMLLLLQLAVGLVLLVACANVANLLLARLSARQKELSVRVALGAGRARIARQLLVEAALLAAAGGALGCVLAWAGQRVVAASGLLPDWAAPVLDARVLGFTAALALAAALLFGLLPALSAATASPQRALREAGRSGRGRRALALRDGLVVVQLALAVALLGSAGLLVRSFANVAAQSPGFDSHGVLSASVALPREQYADDGARANAAARLLEAARALPGVEAAGLVDVRPLSDAINGSSYAIVGQPGNGARPHAFARSVDEDYFRAMGIPLLQGRTFERGDWSSAHKVAVVDELFARKRFPHGDAVGHQIELERPGVGTWQYTIIGVVGTIKNGDLGEEPTQETYYLDYGQSPSSTVVLLLRTAGAAAALAQPLRAAIRSVDPQQPLFDVMTLEARVQQSMTGRRVPMQLIGGFAALALLLAAVGIYGVLAFAVAQRSSEFGVRMAVGADAARIRRLVLGGGARLIVAGLALGLVGAVTLGLVLRCQLFGVGSVDPPSLAIVAAVLAATAFAACWLPAWRAARVAPVEALRHE
ncbi:MAG: ABC transporter permease [Xanthomonadales bacterium]|nr:ABC transporter permease [Xanthomonadales bacterium]